MNDFKALGLSDNTLAALQKKGFTEPTPIQARTIPLLLDGTADIMGQAQTGTGKTAAFALPIIERIREHAGAVQALVLTPTRELAQQVCEEINSLKGKKRLKTLPVYGGQSMVPQLSALKRGVDIVVGTPGRVLDHLGRGTLKLNHLSFFVLDEADEMCNMGFIDDVREILQQAGTDRRTLLFSATMPQEIVRIASDFMNDYETVRVKAEKSDAPLTRQVFHEVAEKDRFEALCRVVDAHEDFYGLVFCRTKLDTDRVAGLLADRGYPAEPIHGDLSQARREEILAKFRKRRATILVATDVAARGIDVPDLTHVVNYALPQEAETYVHRVGRTGRAGKEGTAVSLIAPFEFRRLMFISKATRLDIKKAPLPSVDRIIENKKMKLITDLISIMEHNAHVPYADMAYELLEENDPAEIVAALLKNAYGNDFNPKNYRQINEAPARGTGKRIRMRAALGRTHGMTPKKFVDYICKNTNVRANKIQNVKIQDTYSTFTAPKYDSENIVRNMNRRSHGKKPLVKTQD